MDDLCSVCGISDMSGKESAHQKLEDTHQISVQDTPNKLRNVKVVFLPANTTLILQPMDKGIIRSLKYAVCQFLQSYNHQRMLQSIFF